MRTFVIAEAGSTHGGSLDQMERLVDLAAAIDADACKFQWTSSPARLAERRRAPEYLDAYRLIAFTRAWLPRLASRCSQRGIEFMCTVYLPEDIPVVAPYVRRFKVASFEAADWAFLGAHEKFGKPVIVSVGMYSAWELMCFNKWRKTFDPGCPALLCTSSYPAPVADLNLGAIRQHELQGLSDHTRHPWAGALAVAAGAEIVEFHFRLDDTDPANADYAVSRPPEKAREYIQNLRLAEAMLGDGVKRVMDCEAPMLRYRVRP